MNDYLGRLVSRSLGLAEVIRPRPTGWFESDPHAMQAQPVPALHQPGEARPATPAAPGGIGRPTAEPIMTDPPRPEPETPAPAAVGAPAIHAAQPGPARPPPPAAAGAPSTTLRSLVAATPRMPVPPAVPAPALRPPAATVDRPASENRRPPPPSLAMVPAQPGPATASAEPASGPIAPPRVPRADQPPLPRPRITPAQPAEVAPFRRPSIASPSGIGASRRAASGRDQAVPDRAQPATIQVTIGRVEVRASVVAAAPPRRAAATAAVAMSLEDYLKERAGRSRA